MKNIASLFSNEAREELQKHLGIALSDEHDYGAKELSDLHERITDDFPYAYDERGEPLRMGRVFESVIDVFIHNKLIEFN